MSGVGGPVQALTVSVQGVQQLQTVAQGYQNINQSAANLNNTLQQTATQSTNVGRAQQSVASAFDRLARSYDPILNSLRQLEREERLLERAWRQGIATGQQYGEMMNKIHQRHIDLKRSAAEAAEAEEKLKNVQAGADKGGFGQGNWAGNRNRQLLMQGSQFFQQSMAGGFTPSGMSQAALMQGMDILPMMNLPSMGSAAGMAGMATLGTGAAVAGGLGLAYALGKNVEVFEEHSVKLREVVVGVVADIVIAAKDGAVAVYESVRDSVANAITGIMEYSNTTDDAMRERANNIIGALKTVWDALNTNAGDFGAAIMSGTVDTLNAVTELAENAVNKVLEAIESMTAGIANGVNGLRDIIASGLENLPGTESIVNRLRETRAGGLELGRVSLPRMENTYIEGRDRFRRNRDQNLQENFSRDFIGEAGDYLQGAGMRGRERMQGWGDRATTDRAKEMTKTLELETQAIKDRTAAMDVDKNVREDALRTIDRELALKKTLIDLEKASPNARAAVEGATRAKWAAEDAALTQERIIAQKDLNATQALTIENMAGQAQAYGLEKNARVEALRELERELALRQELANTHPSQHEAVRNRQGALNAAQDTLRRAQAGAGARDQADEMGRETAYGRSRLGAMQSTMGDPLGRRDQLRSLEREYEIKEALLQLSPDVGAAERRRIQEEIRARQGLNDELAKQQEAESRAEYDRSRSVTGAFSDYFVDAANEAKGVGQVMVDVFDNTTQTISGAFVNMALGVDQSLGDILKSMLKMQAQMMLSQGIQMLMGMAGMAMGIVVPNPAGGFMRPGAGGGMGNAGNASKMGNAFEDGAIVHRFRQGGVIDRRGTVPMAEMGEDGPEGVLPLKRRSDGRLGVMAQGGGGGGDIRIEQNITLNPSQGMGQAEADQFAEQAAKALDGKITGIVEKRMGQARRNGGTIERKKHWGT